jgi:hypothetical protein
MGVWSTILILLIGYISGRYIQTLYNNYIAVRGTGLRLVISPITPYTLQWQLASSLLRPLLRKFRWFRVIDWTCAWQDALVINETLGSSFIVVSPGLNVLCTGDAQTIEHVLKKWRDFVKPDNVNGEC